ncbi:MAG TPA: flavin reductase family protein [Synergistales bacterium]|jgi:flavin reductase (DIM6/NTAB) family NADH-FMN oxidoreductase RutF|nr:flavin reductase family protein [Synergistaceae bacterium]HPA59095.1 flavin reductase family protein [Synergistales bacterium]HQO83852.1 flavin reductase family protein [Synergistales bacterium]HQQ10784.1 flavin reductase family protein [Synergistales bacterium]
MKKINIGKSPYPLPMPVVIVGSCIGERPNFMAVAWVTRVNARPALMSVAIGRHATAEAIRETGEFSINIPSVDLVKETDLTGMVSGNDLDKSVLFDVFYGSLRKAPMIRQCPVTMECRVAQKVELPVDILFIGEVTGVWSEERFLTKGSPDIEKVRPFCLTMPDNRYWSMGGPVGRAWSDGEGLKGRLRKVGGGS